MFPNKYSSIDKIFNNQLFSLMKGEDLLYKIFKKFP